MSRKIQKHPNQERLEADYADLMKLGQYSSLIRVSPLHGNPPVSYLITYCCRGWSGGRVADHFEVEMTLPSGYPKKIPAFSTRTPIDHNHVFGSWVCVGGPSGRETSPAIPLRQFVIGVGEMIQGKRDSGRPVVDDRPLEGAEPEDKPPEATRSAARPAQTIPPSAQLPAQPPAPPAAAPPTQPSPAASRPWHIEILGAPPVPASAQVTKPEEAKSPIQIEIVSKSGEHAKKDKDDKGSERPAINIEILPKK